MPNDEKKILPINYTNREFESIRDDLLQVAERFYPDTFQDFSEASFGAMMVDMIAYVGDQLSFYVDYNVNESFLDTAFQYNNVVRHGRILGYKNTGRPSTYGQLAMYLMVPASATGIGPDADYIPILKRGSRFTSTTGLNFVLTENVDFADPLNPVVVARVDDTSGAPTYYAIEAYGNVVSGHFSQERISIGPFERYLSVKLSSPNLSEIMTVFDEDGNEYYEVDYLSQDIVYREIVNSNYKQDNVPSVIKPYLVSRKFVTIRDFSETYLQFGSGKAGETNVVLEPQSVAADIYGKTYTSDLTFDPSRLSNNQNFGIVPSDTVLTVVYRTTNPTNSNVAAGRLNKVSNPQFEFDDIGALTPATVNIVIGSLEVSNQQPIVGDVTQPTTGDIKRRIYDTFPTQNRAVTQADYENIAYRMPAKYGSIKRVSVQKDPDSLKRNLNMYVISEDEQKNLVKTNSTIKNNLKTWLNQYRMVNDTIDILDPYIINIGLTFVAKANAGANKYDVLSQGISVLRDYFKTTYFIGEAFYVSTVYEQLKKVSGIMDVTKVMLTNKVGSGYSSVNLNINENMSPDGTYLIIPKNCIVEIKFPRVDITGKII